MTLWEVAAEISRRLSHLFLRGADGRRPVHGQIEKFQTDPHWRDLLLFYEYFHGDNGAGMGASHQTVDGLVAKLMQQEEKKSRKSEGRSQDEEADNWLLQIIFPDF